MKEFPLSRLIISPFSEEEIEFLERRGFIPRGVLDYEAVCLQRERNG